NPQAEIYPRALTPTAQHWLGTTSFGQDMFAQVIWGTRPVLLIAVGVGLLATVVAMLVGVAAAYLGGAWDGTLNVITDVLLVIPLVTTARSPTPGWPALQFSGVGETNATPCGPLLYWAEHYGAFPTGLPVWIIVPGPCIVALGAAFPLLNYAFDEIGNPS